MYVTILDLARLSKDLMNDADNLSCVSDSFRFLLENLPLLLPNEVYGFA